MLQNEVGVSRSEESAAPTDISRRLLIAGSGAALLALAHKAEAQSLPGMTASYLRWVSSEHRLVRRITYGLTEAEWRRAKQMGFYAYLEWQMNWASLDDSAAESMAHQLYPRAFWTSQQIMNSGADWEISEEFIGYTLFMAAFSKRQLLQRMCQFWSDHFNTSLEKIGAGLLIPKVRDVIRRHALGRFPDLLRGVTKSAAMIAYLDNDQNVGWSPNQNLARELLELHTMGTTGGYTQTDVEEVAKVLSGWTYQWDSAEPNAGEAMFIPENHAEGSKTVLGQTIPFSGATEIDRVLDILINHASTARFMATKLVRFFLGDGAPQSVIDAAASAWQSSRGNIQVVLRSILTRANIVNSPPKYKQPTHFAISAIRALGFPRGSVYGIRWHLAEMGHSPYYWSSPDGYPDNNSFWQGLLLPRINLALRLPNDGTEGLTLPVSRFNTPSEWRYVYDKIGRELLGSEIAEKDRISMRDFLTQYNDNTGADTEGMRAGLALTLASPAFQWY